MDYELNKLARLSDLKALAQKVVAENYAKQNDLKELETKVEGLVTAGGEPNKLEGVKVNGAALNIAEKMVDILIATGSTDGTVSVNGADVAVKGLAALAFKAEVSEAELSAALKAVIDAKAEQTDVTALQNAVDVLNGTGTGSVSKSITDAFNEFAANVSDDGVVNTYKELIDYAATHGAEFTELVGKVTNLTNLVGTLPEGAAADNVVAYIAEAIAAIGIGDYAKTTEVTEAINTALGNYYTSAQIDAMIATDQETTEMLAEVFPAE